jgi:beta-lactamase superfamily II metal-dependent hydrolase
MFEIDFLSVGAGNADAICVRHGDEQTGYYLHVIDGGYSDTGQKMISHIETHYGRHYFIHNMVLSHADNDHAAGLIEVMKRFEVKNLYMNMPWLYVAEVIEHFHGNYTMEGLAQEIRAKHQCLVELERLARQKGTPIWPVFQGTVIGPFTVLAPSRQRYVDLIPDLEKTPDSYRVDDVQGPTDNFFGQLLRKAAEWFDETWDIETLSNNPDPTSASNETSVVQLGTLDNISVLLTGDAGPVSLNEAADYALTMGRLAPPKIVQVPHHGSRRNVTPAVLDRWLGPMMAHGAVYGTAYCSVGSTQKDYPRGQVQNAFERRGYPVHVTRGISKCHFAGCARRSGWSPSSPEPFATRVDS